MAGSDSYTVLLIHSATSDGSTTFVDSGLGASCPHALTAVDNVHHESDQQKFNATSIEFDGTGDLIRADDHADWYFATGDFTIDCWLRFPTVPSDFRSIIAHYQSSGNQRSWLFGFNGATNELYFQYSTDGTAGTVLTYSWTPSQDTWYHLAAVRYGSYLNIYIDGTRVINHSIGGASLYNSNTYLTIGCSQSSSGFVYNIEAYLDEIRIKKGEAVWTGASFSVPTAPYGPEYTVDGIIESESEVVNDIIFDIPIVDGIIEAESNVETVIETTVISPAPPANDEYTVLLVHSNNPDTYSVMTDSGAASTCPHDLDEYGDVHHETDKHKFGISSIQFDGTGDYFSADDSSDWYLSNLPFCIDFWILFGASPTSGTIISQYDDFNLRAWRISYYQPSNLLQFLYSTTGTWAGTTTVSATFNPSVDTWYHIAVTRWNGTLRIFIDGVLQTSHAIGSAVIYNSSCRMAVGCQLSNNTPALFFTGYLDEIRIHLNPTSVWTSSFTPPSAAYGVSVTVDGIIESESECLAPASLTLPGDMDADGTVESAGVVETIAYVDLPSTIQSESELTVSIWTEECKYHAIEAETEVTASISVTYYVNCIVQSNSDVIHGTTGEVAFSPEMPSESDVETGIAVSCTQSGIIESESDVLAESSLSHLGDCIVKCESELEILEYAEIGAYFNIQSESKIEANHDSVSHTVSGIVESCGIVESAIVMSHTGEGIIQSESVASDDYTGETEDTLGLVLSGLGMDSTLFTKFSFDAIVEDSSGNMYVSGEDGIFILGAETDSGDMVHPMVMMIPDGFGSNHNKFIRTLSFGRDARYATTSVNSIHREEEREGICENKHGGKFTGSRHVFGKCVGFDIEDFDEIGPTRLELVRRR